MKVFLVETLLNLVIYVRNVHSKNTEEPFRIYYHIYTIAPNDTLIQTISIALQYLVFLF